MFSKKPTYTLEIPPELVEENDSYTFAMWTKFSYTYPVRLFEMDFLTNQEELVLGRFANSEIEDSDNQKENRFAALIFKNGAYYLQAYDENAGSLRSSEPIETTVSEIEGRWVWSIVSYSTSEDKAVLGMYFAETDRWEFHELEAPKKLPLATLKFLSGPSFGLRSINGLFFDTRFEFEFFGNEADIKNFFDTEVNFPKDYKDPNDSSAPEDGESLVSLLEAEAFFDSTLDTPANPMDFKEKFSGVREYGVRGWYKFTGDQVEGDPVDRLVFRLTINNPAKYENTDDKRLGDRVLALTI